MNVTEVKPQPYAAVEHVKMGEVVREATTGIQGTINMKVEYLSGVTQFSIQPEGDGKSIPEAYLFDWFLLERVGEGLSARVPEPDKKAKFKVGDKLRNIVTGVVGIALQKITYVNGCVSYGTQPVDKNKSTGEPAAMQFTDYKSLELVVEKAVPPAPKSKTGGPSMRSGAIQRAPK